MLNLTTQALNPQQLKERLEVKYKELDVIRNNLSAVATHGALVAGFAFQGMRAESFGDNCPVSLRGAFYLTAVSVMGLELYTVFMSTLWYAMSIPYTHTHYYYVVWHVIVFRISCSMLLLAETSLMRDTLTRVAINHLAWC